MADEERRTKTIFHDIARFRVQMFDRLIAPHGLTMSQAWVLAHLFREDELTQSEIAKRMEVGTVTVGGLVDRLEMSGLVERRTDPVDRRAKRVCLKPAAKPLGRVMEKCGEEVNKASYAGLPAAKVEELNETLMTIRQNLLDTSQQDKVNRENA